MCPTELRCIPAQCKNTPPIPGDPKKSRVIVSDLARSKKASPNQM